MRQFKGSIFDVLVYSIFLSTLLLFSIAKAQIEYNYFFIFFCLFLLFLNPKYILLLYVIILPTNGIISKEFSVFGILGIKQIVSLFAFFYLLTISKKNDEKSIIEISKPLKILFSIYIVYGVYTAFKNAYFGLEEYDLRFAFLKSGNILIMNVPLLFLIDKIQSSKVLNSVSIGAVFGIINMIIFVLISPMLSDFGIKTIGLESTEFDNSSYSRYAGVMADGDSNTMGAFMVLCFGFMLNQYEYYRKYIVYGLIGFTLLCIALSGSRTAFLSLMVIAFLFYVRDRNSKLKIQLFVIFICLIIVSLPLWQMVIDRLALSNNQLETDTSSNRIGKWILYMTYIIQNPETFVYGTEKELRIGWNDRYHAVHNVYIQVLYNAGLLFVIALWWSYFIIIKQWKKMKIQQNLWYVFLPFLFITMTVSDIGIIYYTVLFLVLMPAQYKLVSIQALKEIKIKK